jgi:hypothetical protein
MARGIIGQEFNEKVFFCPHTIHLSWCAGGCLLLHSGPENGDSHVALENLIYWICNQKKKSLEYFVKGVGNETNDKQKNEIIMNVLLILLYHVACHQIASIRI